MLKNFLLYIDFKLRTGLASTYLQNFKTKRKNGRNATKHIVRRAKICQSIALKRLNILMSSLVINVFIKILFL